MYSVFEQFFAFFLFTVPLDLSGLLIPLTFIVSSKLVLILVFSFIIFYLFNSTNLYFLSSTINNFCKNYYNFLFNLLKGSLIPSALLYFPFLFLTFSFIFFSNFIGMIALNFTTTCQIFVTFGIALTILFGYEIIAFSLFKVKNLANFLPEGVPIWLSLFLPIIEFISSQFKVVSLSIRLIANMVSGHLLLHIFLAFICKFIFFTNVFLLFIIFKPLAFLLLFALVCLELGVAGLQAYVFIVLLSLYLNQSLVAH